MNWYEWMNEWLNEWKCADGWAFMGQGQWLPLLTALLKSPLFGSIFEAPFTLCYNWCCIYPHIHPIVCQKCNFYSFIYTPISRLKLQISCLYVTLTHVVFCRLMYIFHMSIPERRKKCNFGWDVQSQNSSSSIHPLPNLARLQHSCMYSLQLTMPWALC